MSVYGLVLDPPAAISGRTELSLNSGAIQTTNAGVDFGTAAVAQYLAEQRYGSSPVSFRVPNRTITIPLLVGAEANGTVAEGEEARRKLNEKVALLQRQGGVLMRQRVGGEPLYADIVDAQLTLPDVYGETGGVEPNVSLVLTTLPDFYGEEIALDAVEQTGQIVQVLQQGGKQAVIEGDYPARTRIVLTEKSEHDQLGMLWGLRSTHYDSTESGAGTALFYDAAALTPLNGAEVVTESSAFSGKVIELTKPEVNTWHPFLSTDVLGGILHVGPLNHIGSYRVWARVFAVAGRFRFVWSSGDAITPTYNSAIIMGAVTESQRLLLDLGEIRLSAPPVGESHWWRGVLQVNTGNTSTAVMVDRIWFQPVDDGAGRLRATGVPTSTLLGPTAEGATAENNATIQAGKVWTNPTLVQEGHPSEAASIALAAKEQGEALLVKAFGFAIPTGTTVKGILVTTHATVAGFTKPEAVPTVQLVKGTTVRGTKAGSTSLAVTPSYGSSSDTWGVSWTPAEVNASTFGVAISLLGGTTSSGTELFTVAITIYYSYSSAAITEDAVLYSKRKSEIRFDGAFREDTASEAYIGVSQVTGDLPRLPPSGLEGRPVELLVKNSRGDLTPGKTDAGIDKIKAQVLYRPCFLGRI